MGRATWAVDNLPMNLPTARPATTPLAPLRWDVFCQVIDNFGDAGVCWRLCATLAARGHQVRLWIDDGAPLDWMAPGARLGQWPGIEVLPWAQAANPAFLATCPPGDVWIESFGCELPPVWLQWHAAQARLQAQPPAWINLEYLSAEPFALRSHGLPSPVLSGPALGWTKHFFYPGLAPASGGLLRSGAASGNSAWADGDPALRVFAPELPGQRSVLLFSYPTAPLAALVQALRSQDQPMQLLVAAGAGQQALAQAAGITLEDALRQGSAITLGALQIRFLPFLAQTQFDALLSLCALNLVRGEDSLAQAVQAGRPSVWQIYPQDDGAHHAKLQAYLDATGASTAERAWHAFWNQGAQNTWPQGLHWPWEADSDWAPRARKYAQTLISQDDLCTRLLGFVHSLGRTAAQP